MDAKARGLLVGLGLSLVIGCGEEPPPGGEDEDEEIAAIVADVVYGRDDRSDVFEAPRDVFFTRATESSVALVSHGFLRSTPEGIVVGGTSLGEVEGLCDDQRFATQPMAASCSGTLVADDLVLTAGHCVRSLSACANFAIVFNFRMASETRVLPVDEDDVYSCVEIVSRALPGVSSLDFAFLRLDRPVAPHLRPAPMRPEAELLERGASITMIGHPSGLPAKITGGASVLDESIRSGNLFLTNLDAFAGNSGSGIYDDRGRLAGVLVWGDRDYRNRDGEECREVNVAQPSEGMEGAVYAFRALDELCRESAHASSVCASHCAQGRCDDALAHGCDGDCPPPSWSCDAGAFGSGGACDCACGAIDPDCALPSRPVYGCQDDMTCGEAATCVDDPGKSSRSAFLRGCAAASGAETGAAAFGALLVAAAARRRRREIRPEM